MRTCRQYIYVTFCFMLTGCYGIDVTPWVYNSSPFSQETQNTGNALCSGLYGNTQFNRLKGKMPVMPGRIPTRAMLNINAVPNEMEVAAIQRLEGAIRNCGKLRAAAGVPTSATEDILSARISKLRYGLYKGQIPYAVYNYGVAQAMRTSNNFMMSGEKAAQEGKQFGQQRQAQMETMNAMIRLNANVINAQNSLDNFNNSIPTGTWFCRGVTCD